MPPGYMPCLPTRLPQSDNCSPGVAECELLPQGLAARGNSALINSLDTADMPMHVSSISSMSVCHAWQDGFEIVYGKGKGPRPQTVAADVPAPKAAPAAEAQPAQQPPPQVKCQPCKGLSVSPM